MLSIASRWRDARPLVRAEMIATSWEIFSVMLFQAAVVPAAFATPWPSLGFLGGLAVSTALAGPLTRRGRRGLAAAAILRTVFWLLAVTPLFVRSEFTVVVATLGFGVMAGAIRRAIYRRYLDPLPKSPSPVRLRSDLRVQLAENAMVAGMVGGHLMLLFSVAFLRTASKVVFRAWWEIIPVLAILGTVGFTLAVRPLTDRVILALRAGRKGTDEALAAGLAQATAIPRRLSYINFLLWLTCTSIGILYFQPGPQRWHWPDAIMQLAFGSLFSWGISFYQRGWHEDAVAPIVQRLRAWTGRAGEEQAVDLRRRMLSDFGLPLLFTLTLSLFASIGLYRTLGQDLPLREDFNAISALWTSFLILTFAVGGVFLRAARKLSEPLTRLEEAADQVARGKLDAEVPRVEGPTEVMGLGRSIERMRQALAQTIAELKEERAGLETHVEQRTAELREALDELRQTQTALIQGERMALIGELVAGVAHEVYNPLNAIAGSISSLERVRAELTEILTAYQGAEALLPEAARRDLEKKRGLLDIAGALDDLAGVEKVVQSATRRSVEIVASLKSFARAPAEPIPSDLHAGLGETLSLLGHRLDKQSIEVVERLGEIPEVVCRSGEINQVFMNLLSNAIQAVADRHPDGGGRIEVLTRTDGDGVLVSFTDNGPGVPEPLRRRVFDPFFTTKPMGEGTGLGLSISVEIIRRHGGRLAVERADDVDGGARFSLWLPLVPRPARSLPSSAASAGPATSKGPNRQLHRPETG